MSAGSAPTNPDSKARVVPAGPGTAPPLSLAPLAQSAPVSDLLAWIDVIPAPVVFAADRECTHIAGNRAALTLFRLAPGANLADNAPEGQTPAYFRFFANDRELRLDELPLQVAARGTRVSNYEMEVLFDDGARCVLQVNASPLLNDAGEPTGAVAVLFDITERHDREQALRRSEEEFRAMFELESVGTASAIEGRLARVNGKFCEITGFSEKELLGRSVLDFLPPEDAEQERSCYEKLLRGELANYETEKRFVRGDGRETRVHVHVRALTGGRAVATVRDVTDERRLEAEWAAALSKLSEETRRLSMTLESIADGVIAVNADGRIVTINRVACDLTGCAHGDALGRVMHDICCFADANSVCVCSQWLAAGSAVTKDIPEGTSMLVKKSGAKRHVGGTVAYIVNAVGTAGLVIVFRDIAEQCEREEQQLKSQKLEALGILAGGIAHDFNNILTALFGNIQLARLSHPLGHPAQSSLREAEQAVERARGLSQQLLTFAKGGAPIRKTGSIAELLIEATTLVLHATNIEREFKIAPGLWRLKFDEGQMSRVFHNIAINAQQAMPAGGRFRVEANNLTLSSGNRFDLPPGRYVELRFKDWGGGIAPEHRARIFDPFFTTKGTGSGLGLSTAYSIVKRHEGCITVNSKLGRGSTFIICLPADDADAHSDRPQEGRAVGGRVLVMDDDAAVRQVASGLLRWLGYETKTANDGEEAVREYEHARREGAPFTAVILDLTVPGGMGGVECLHRLKAIDPEVRALVSSGYSNDPIMAGYREQGFAGVVSKPYSVVELGAALSALLAQS